jgi:replicative DNA helicase
MNDSEQALLSIIAQDPQWTRENASQLSPVLFDREAHRLIFEAITECGSQWDAVTITNALRRQKKLELVGGAAGVSELFMGFPVMSLAKTHLEAVRDAATLRRALRTHREAQALLEAAITQGTANPAELLGQIREKLDAAGRLPGKRLDRLTASQALDRVIEQMEERAKNPGAIPGLSTGFALMDKHTFGLQEQHLWVFAGEPGSGKSTIMQNVLEAAALNCKTAVYQLEMSIEEQAMRFLASDAQVDSGNMLTGLMTYEEQMAIAAGVKRLRKAGTDFIDTSSASAEDILADLEASDYRVAMVDYLQLMEIQMAKGENREQAMSRVARQLKNVAKRKGMTVLTGSQLNDDGRLRESRAIGQHADKVGMVRKVEIDGEVDVTKRLLVFEKNRGGPPQCKIPMMFNGASFSFREQTGEDWTEDMADKPEPRRRKGRN